MISIRGVLTWLLQPIILLYKLLFGRRSSDASQQPDATTTFVLAHDSEEYSDSLPLPIGEYEVFLSFRGPDTRHQLTDILYRFLVNLKIRTFRDDDELRKGEGIWPNLVKAIGQSKVYVPILSESYAHSKWCLKELAEIVACRKRNEGHIILPIFYMVDPRDVRHQTGPYQSAFQQHEKNFDANTIQVWRDALNEVGTLKGWHVKSKDEQGAIADCISDIVWSHLSKNDNLIDTNDLVGIDYHIDEVIDKMSLDSGGVTMVGLYGLGGIGKTTIATAVYSKISTRFDRRSFLENIRETQEQKDGTLSLQKKLISNIMRTDSVGSIDNISEGRRLIQDRVSQFKVLVILDDVDEKFNFDDILGNPKNFVSGSRFIITSRNMKVLSTLNENQCKLYGVGEMSPQLSLQLFCKHAFKTNAPPSDYEALSKEIVSTTGGLPLTLKVVGSLLFREDKYIWEDKLAQLRETPEKEVLQRLKISYDALGYGAKQIFLDVVCFFIGMEREMPSYMWSDCQFHPASSINILIQRCMIKIGDDNEFQVHDQLRDMGREIVCEENIEEPWMRSRIWQKKEGREILLDKKGSKHIKACRAHFSEYNLNYLEPEHFSNLSQLRYFEAKNMDFKGDFTNLLPNLRWLRLRSQYLYDDSFLTSDLRNLVILDLQSSENFISQFKQIKMANKLKVLDLSGCYTTHYLPEFPQSGSLEILNLSRCGMGELDCAELDIRNLWNLKRLNLDDAQLEAIKGGTIGMVKRLQELDMTDLKCKNLQEALVDIGKLSSLKILKTIGASYKFWESEEEEEEDEDEKEKEVVEENKKDVLELGKLPTSLKLLATSSRVVNLSELLELEELTVQDCDFGLEIPPLENPWRNASKLTSLVLKETKMVAISATTSSTPSIPKSSSWCLVRLPSSLTSIHISFCPELEWLPTLENLENLTELFVRFCPKLQEIRGLEGLKSLQSLEIDGGHQGSLTHIHGLEKLLRFKNLQTLEIWRCRLLADDSVDGGSGDDTIHSLQTLVISQCNSILLHGGGRRMPLLSKFPRLTTLQLGSLIDDDHDDHDEKKAEPELQLQGIADMEELESLRLFDLPAVERLPSLSKLRKLKRLSIKNMPRLREIQGTADLNSLGGLYVDGCPSLEILDVRGCTKLTSQQLSALKASLPNVQIMGPGGEVP